ncbi:unnamed protein product [Pelagomonas calceolata]|uniref:Uncharacterized protein n=1 Tax=Pelagomonas calceolata TaxID=35677 RepID=A0A8J2X0T8_9STRA|nr:unnamed protein product [Pelagomonas calceolata]
MLFLSYAWRGLPHCGVQVTTIPHARCHCRAAALTGPARKRYHASRMRLLHTQLLIIVRHAVALLRLGFSSRLRRARQPLLCHARRGLRIFLREGRLLLELLDAPLVGPRLLVVVERLLVHEVSRRLDAVELAAARQVIIEGLRRFELLLLRHVVEDLLDVAPPPLGVAAALVLFDLRARARFRFRAVATLFRHGLFIAAACRLCALQLCALQLCALQLCVCSVQLSAVCSLAVDVRQRWRALS